MDLATSFGQLLALLIKFVLGVCVVCAGLFATFFVLGMLTAVASCGFMTAWQIVSHLIATL